MTVRTVFLGNFIYNFIRYSSGLEVCQYWQNFFTRQDKTRQDNGGKLEFHSRRPEKSYFNIEIVNLLMNSKLGH